MSAEVDPKQSPVDETPISDESLADINGGVAKGPVQQPADWLAQEPGGQGLENNIRKPS